MGGRVVHFEIPYDDADRAREFYEKTFGWQAQPVPGMDYTMVSTGPVDERGEPREAGFISGGMFHREPGTPSKPVVVIDVDSIDATLSAVDSQGGRTVIAKQPVGDMGFTAYVEDPEGNVIGLWETAHSH